MTVYKSADLIDDLQKQTQDFIEKAISEWQMTSPQKLLQQPETNKWSAAQCLEHLNSYGRYYLPEIEKTIEAAKQNGLVTAELFRAGWLGDYFTKLMLPDVKGKKMKKMSAPKNHVPAVNLNADKVVSEFIEQQEKLILLLEHARRINLEKAKVAVSIAKFIRLKLGDTFRFLLAHNYRHILQAERALAADLQGEVIQN